MAITADMVKKLREQTGAGMMDCKKALTDANGDFERAVALLREKGLAVAAKREAKTASEGKIGSYITPDTKKGILVELNCETSFVANTDEFGVLAADIAAAAAEGPDCNDLECLLPRKLKSGQTVHDEVNEIMGKVGEKMTLTRITRFDTDGVLGSYIHMGSQIGVLVDLVGASASDAVLQLAKDIAMQISWSNPDYLKRDEVSADAMDKERAIHREWAKKEGKPENIIEKIVEGRMKEFYQRVCLLEQLFIKDEEKTIQQLINEVNGKAGANISVARFARFRVGETAGE